MSNPKKAEAVGRGWLPNRREVPLDRCQDAAPLPSEAAEAAAQEATAYCPLPIDPTLKPNGTPHRPLLERSSLCMAFFGIPCRWFGA